MTLSGFWVNEHVDTLPHAQTDELGEAADALDTEATKLELESAKLRVGHLQARPLSRWLLWLSDAGHWF